MNAPDQFKKFISGTPKCEVVSLTKPLVDWLISINTDNRPIKPNVVNNYMREILAGEWLVTSQGIGISTDGVLLDGQHRLLAVKKAGYPEIRTILAFGIDKRAQIKIDTHAKRSANDLLALYLHIKSNKLLGPAIKTALWMTNRSFGQGFAISDLGDTYQEYVDDWNNIPIKSGKFGVAGALAGCCMFATHNGANKGMVADFFTRFLTGENIDRTNPIYWLRENKKELDRTARGYQTRVEWLTMVAKALAMHLRGETRNCWNKSPKDFKTTVDELENTARSNRQLV